MQTDLVHDIGNTILAILRSRMAKLPPLRGVWIDERLKQIPVPFAMRSLNPPSRCMSAAPRVPFRADAKFIRPFIHWHDEKGTQDPDLSVNLYDEHLHTVSHVSFTGLTSMGCWSFRRHPAPPGYAAVAAYMNV